MTSIGPASCARIGNRHYKSDDEFVFACADAMRAEYKAIVDAGLVLQIDDPAIAENFDQINPEPSFEDYRKFTMPKIEALNHALKGLPQDRIRFHLCWGSWHGPHMTDVPMKEIVGLMPLQLDYNKSTWVMIALLALIAAQPRADRVQPPPSRSP